MMVTLAANVTCYTRMESPVGPLLLVADDSGLRRIEFVNGRKPVQADPQWHDDADPFAKPSASSAPTLPESWRPSISGSRPRARRFSSRYGIIYAKSLTGKPFPTASWLADWGSQTLRARLAWPTAPIQFRL
jgi:6-O-methylguanine DNA methyltransferase, ribonuclease-like domain